jgi:hypothetical protein
MPVAHWRWILPASWRNKVNTRETRHFIIEQPCPKIKTKNMKGIRAIREFLPVRVAVYTEPEENRGYPCDADKVFRVHCKSLNHLRKKGVPVAGHKVLYVCEHMGRMDGA